MSKARIAEIFAAMSGIITEGANLSRQGVKIADHPLVGLASDGAMKLWDAKYTAVNRPLSSKGDQEHIVRPLMQFLTKASPVLCDHSLVGKVALVSKHVREILEAEVSTEPRAPERFKDGGVLVRPFKAEYLSKAATEVEDPTKVVDQDEDAEMAVDSSGIDAPVVSAPIAGASKRGRPSTTPQPAFV